MQFFLCHRTNNTLSQTGLFLRQEQNTPDLLSKRATRDLEQLVRAAATAAAAAAAAASAAHPRGGGPSPRRAALRCSSPHRPPGRPLPLPNVCTLGRSSDPASAAAAAAALRGRRSDVSRLPSERARPSGAAERAARGARRAGGGGGGVL